MPLIVKSVLRRDIILHTDISSIHILVDRKYLSEQYNIPFLPTSWVKGEILEVLKVHEGLNPEEKEVLQEHVIGKPVKFFLNIDILGFYDKLY